MCPEPILCSSCCAVRSLLRYYRLGPERSCSRLSRRQLNPPGLKRLIMCGCSPRAKILREGPPTKDFCFQDMEPQVARTVMMMDAMGPGRRCRAAAVLLGEDVGCGKHSRDGACDARQASLSLLLLLVSHARMCTFSIWLDCVTLLRL